MDGRVFVITERAAKLMEEVSMTHYKFVNNVGKFLEALLQDPVNSKPSDVLAMNGLDRDTLLKQLVERGIVKRDSSINDKEKPVFKVKYSVPRSGFLRKVNKMYMDFFGENVDIDKKPVNEDGDGGAMGGGCASGCSDAAGATATSTIDGGGAGAYFIQPMGMVKKRKIYSPKKQLTNEEHVYDELKTGKELDKKQKKIVKDIENIISGLPNKKSKLGVFDSFIDKYGTLTCVISGGLNGPGKWEDYLKDMAKLIQKVKDAGIHIWMIEGENDCLDDVFTMNFGVRRNDKESD